MGPSLPDTHGRSLRPRLYPLLAAGLLALVAALALAVNARGQDLQGQVDAKRSQLEGAQSQQGVLSNEIASYDAKIAELTGQVAALRNREARVQQELEEAEEQLRIEKRNLEILKQRLEREIGILRKRLVAIYKDEGPDALTVVLEADGFEALLERYEYLERIESQDSNIVERVRGLRNDQRETVERITAVRDSIAAKRRELERTRINLEAREAELATARSRSNAALSEVNSNIKRLEGGIASLEGEIQAQLAAAQERAEAEAAEQAAASSASSAPAPAAPAPAPAGPVRNGSNGMIWPVSGPLVSPFGMRWGRLHAGVDISAPAGTPIRAAMDGTIALTQSDGESGGYGNFTCIDHGGGLSTCYAHQSSFSITSGSVKQGDVIGSVGCTGSCFGDHLHFEVRMNGEPTDPMGYL